MKKFSCILAIAVLISGIALGAYPWTESNTSVTTSVAFTNTLSASGKTLTAVLANTGATQTNTVKVISGAVTNTLATEASSASDQMIVITNSPILFKDDVVLITSTSTNAHSVIIQGTQVLY